MKEWFIFFPIAVVFFLSYLWVVYKHRDPQKKKVQYSCGVCSGRDCICHKESNGK